MQHIQFITILLVIFLVCLKCLIDQFDKGHDGILNIDRFSLNLYSSLLSLSHHQMLLLIFVCVKMKQWLHLILTRSYCYTELVLIWH